LAGFLVIALAVAAICLSALQQIRHATHAGDRPTLWANDIDYIWLAGYRVRHGDNPYGVIHSSEMVGRDKRADHLPLFYFVGAATQVPFPRFGDWLLFWRVICFTFHVGIAALMFWPLYARRQLAAALFAVLFWTFGRWTLNVLASANIDFPAIFFLVLSMLLLRSRPKAGALCFGTSLAVKQIGVFLAPLYLLWAWQSPGPRRAKRAVAAAVCTAIIPAILSLPFFIADPISFVHSLAFPAFRAPASHFDAPALGGLGGRVMMPFLMVLIFIAAARRRLGMFTSALLTLATFVDFNQVLWKQYMCWLVPLVPLLILDRPAADHDAPRPAAPLPDAHGMVPQSA